MLIAVAQATEAGIDGGALAFMLISMSLVTALTAWCFYRVLQTGKRTDRGGTDPANASVPGGTEGRKNS